MTWWVTTVQPDEGESAAELDDTGPRYEMYPGERRLLLRLLAQGPFVDGWSEMMRRTLLARFVVFRTQAELAGQWVGGDAEIETAWEGILALPEAALMRAALLSDADHLQHYAELSNLLRYFAERADDPWLSKKDLARYYNVNLRDAQLRQQTARVRRTLQLSLAAWPGPANPAYAVQQSYAVQRSMAQ